jgi:flagellar assembly protein FliH
MILLSNLIKFSHYTHIDDKKVINLAPANISKAHHKKDQERNQEEIDADKEKDLTAEAESKVEALKQQIIKDAEEVAESQLKAAKEQAELIKQDAENEIGQWWEERRKADELHIEEMQGKGFEEGFQKGRIQAEAEVLEEYQKTISEAKSMLEQAMLQKEQIIQEAEPFLIELSCEISRKIIHQQLTVSQEWMIDLVKKVLARKREQGVITLCVSPAHFSYIQDAKDELALAIDSQAELQILPDATVKDHGCVIRSNFGSIDARIDTQLTEIKSALSHMAAAHGQTDD